MNEQERKVWSRIVWQLFQATIGISQQPRYPKPYVQPLADTQ